jgi:acetyltransferase-like isoleucine patch superfamily enzyme
MDLGKNVSLKNAKVTWPHKVKIGHDCTLEHNIHFKHDGPFSSRKSIIIGNHCFIGANVEFNIVKKLEIKDNVLIASGTKIVDHNHGILKDLCMNIQPAKDIDEILIEEDVWIGFNSVLLPGSKIRKGAILAAQSVLNKEMGEYEIWAGVPAKKIGMRA